MVISHMSYIWHITQELYAACRALSWDHPARIALAKEAHMLANGILNLRELQSIKQQGLQYSDLHGVPCLLILCEKGRMGDTFPQTFACLDLRIRTSDNATTFVQELGRLCRYPSAPSPLQNDSARQANPPLELAKFGRISSFLRDGQQVISSEPLRDCQSKLLWRVLDYCNGHAGRALFPGDKFPPCF